MKDDADADTGSGTVLRICPFSVGEVKHWRMSNTECMNHAGEIY